MPLGFSQHSKDGTRKVLKLKKTLYGLCQSPRAFWKYITEKLKACELEQSKFDPCLFVGTLAFLCWTNKFSLLSSLSSLSTFTCTWLFSLLLGFSPSPLKQHSQAKCPFFPHLWQVCVCDLDHRSRRATL
jgi:hypothetical protein